MRDGELCLKPGNSWVGWFLFRTEACSYRAQSSGEDPLPRSIGSSWDPFNSKASKEIEESIITISLGEGAQWSGGDPGRAQAKPLRESL